MLLACGPPGEGGAGTARSEVKAMPLKILVYTDGRPAAEAALRLAAELHHRTGAHLAVITVRRGTHADEKPPPVGVDLPMAAREGMPEGIRHLMAAQDVLADAGVLTLPGAIRIRPISHGYLFLGASATGQRIPFYESFGHFLETLNLAVEEHHYDLLVVAPPRVGGLRRWLMGDAARRLALDLHTSLLVVREGRLDSRIVVCADGSPSARRIFPLLRALLPAIERPVEMLCVRTGKSPDNEDQAAGECLQKVRRWLEICGKEVRMRLLEGADPLPLITTEAGREALVVMGESLRHDVYRRVVGSLPIQFLQRSEASLLLVKLPPEAEGEMFGESLVC
jgi:nucleotide-binding universal stress UspA family protein